MQVPVERRAWLAPLRQCEWVVYAKRPFAGPAAVLAYLSRYTHRVAIANSRLLALDERGVTFRWKDYRAEGRTRHKTMSLSTAEFMRRFLLHVLPGGFHRIRHYGLLANARRKSHLATARTLLHQPAPAVAIHSSEAPTVTGHPQPTFRCRRCIRQCRRERPWPHAGGRTSMAAANGHQASAIAPRLRTSALLPPTPSSSSSQRSLHAPPRPLKSP